MINKKNLYLALNERNRYYETISKVPENKYPSSIGFINSYTEIYVLKENIFNRFFNPHFYLYNHKTKNIKEFEFKKIHICDDEILDFLNTVRIYSIDRKLFALNRTYYVDLIGEWETVNKCLMNRKFICL